MIKLYYGSKPEHVGDADEGKCFLVIGADNKFYPQKETQMEDYQDRVLQEKQELDVKINKLTGFLYSDKSTGLDKEEYKRMRQQLYCMMDYGHCLTERINNFSA